MAIALDPKTKIKVEMTRIAAIKELLDRGYGWPRQALQHSGAMGSYDLTNLTDEPLATLTAILGLPAGPGVELF